MMSSPSKISAGQLSYYLNLSREDYYLNGGEPPGVWCGRGASDLDLAGKIEPKELKATMLGFSLDGSALVQNAGKENRQCAWDLTFSAPKPVSTLWSQGDEHVRREIQQAQLDAVKAALSFFEEEFELTRRGRGGTDREKARLVFATFEHGTSRDMDPNLHTHALMMNLGIREDGTCGTIMSRPFFDNKHLAGALYRAELAAQLEQRLGVRCEYDGKFAFTIEGVDGKLNDEFSKRRKAILEELKSYGAESAAAAAAATLETRSKKGEIPSRSELFETWREVGRTFGFDLEKVVGRAPRLADGEKEFKKALEEALDCITSADSHFTERQLLEEVAIHAQGKNLSAKFIREQVQETLEHSKQIRSLGEWNGEHRYTTREVLKIEDALIQSADRLKANHRGHGASETATYKAIAAADKPLNEEQKDAVWHLTGKGGGLRSLEGLAGTGKTSTLAVAREALEEAGYKVIGAALSGKAAKELSEGAGIESQTIASLQMKMHPSLEYSVKHHLHEMGRAAQDKKTFKLDPLKLDKKTVLVLDEAAMISTKEFASLVSDVAKAGALLITVFDRKQLQAIGPGGGAAFLADVHGKASLNTIVRQHKEQDAETVKYFANGKVADALKTILSNGDMHVARNREAAMNKLVSDWSLDAAGKREGSLIFAGTRSEVAALNDKCQSSRLHSGEISGEMFSRNGLTLYEGDRVLFTKNSKALDVQNGSLGTVIDLKPKQEVAIVKLDDGPTVQVPLKTYNSVQLGYAVTTHKGQGTTVDNAYILAGGSMQDRELSYVQASRARESTRFYIDRHEAGKELSQLTKQMEKSREKVLAHEIIKAQEEIKKEELRLKRTIRI